MDNQENANFYFSGLLSLAFFILCLFLAATMLFSPSKNNSFGLKKDTYISISLNAPEVKSHKQKKVKKTAAIQEISTPKKDVDINNLFSDVWTKNILHKKEKPKLQNSKRLLDIQKKIQIKKENDVESLSKKVHDLDSIDTKSEEDSSSTAEQVNEYLAKIQAIVYQYFRVPPNSQGSSVKTVIELDSLGKVLDFRVLTYSKNDALNREADKIKMRLMHVIFPENPLHRSSKTIIILISKE